jgi:hypothetical protein
MLQLWKQSTGRDGRTFWAEPIGKSNTRGISKKWQWLATNVQSLIDTTYIVQICSSSDIPNMLLKVLFQSVPPDTLSAVRMHPKSVAFRNSNFQLKATICQTNLNVEDPHVDIILDECPLQDRDLNISFIMRQVLNVVR